MTARNINTGKIYEGGYTYIGRIVGLNRSTLWRWENQKNIISEIYNNYEIRFEPVIREKQKKGFALR